MICRTETCMSRQLMTCWARSASIQRAGISFWDSMIVRSAAEMGCAAHYFGGSERRPGLLRGPRGEPLSATGGQPGAAHGRSCAAFTGRRHRLAAGQPSAASVDARRRWHTLRGLRPGRRSRHGLRLAGRATAVSRPGFWEQPLRQMTRPDGQTSRPPRGKRLRSQA